MAAILCCMQSNMVKIKNGYGPVLLACYQSGKIKFSYQTCPEKVIGAVFTDSLAGLAGFL